MTHFTNRIAQRWNAIDESWRVAILVFVIARLFYFIWAWVIFSIQPVAVQNFELSGEPILSVFQLENSEAHVYLRSVNGETLVFQAVGDTHLIDQNTNSLWDISEGKAIQGLLEGVALSTAKTTPADLFPYHGVAPYPGRWLAMWQRFDANWYLSIAENGYGSIPGDIHFPPFYPLLIRVLQPLFRNTFLAGLVLSNLASLFALKLLYDRFKQLGERSVAKRALLFFAIFPTFFFFFSAYSEPMFLIAALLSLRAMEAQAWHWAGFWVFCAILIRLQGVALLAPMVFLMWRDQPFLQKLSHWIGLIVAGIGGLFYLYLRFQLPAESTVPFVETNLHARLAPPWESYWYSMQMLLAGNATFIDALNWFVTTLFILLFIWGWRKLPMEYNIYTVCSLLIFMTRIVETQPLMSMVRYSITLFPSFYVLALAGENAWLRRAVIYPCILLNLYLSGQFLIWGWVA
jgi:hypothetical protein